MTQALVDDHLAFTASALQEVVKTAVLESSQDKEAGQEGWWRKLEAALASAGSVSEDLADVNTDETSSGRAPLFDVHELFANVIPNLLRLTGWSTSINSCPDSDIVLLQTFTSCKDVPLCSPASS